MANCGKREFLNENLALEALLQARIVFGGNAAKSIYQCENCENWHLTSKGELHPMLQTQMAEGKIKKLQEAMFWEIKLKK